MLRLITKEEAWKLNLLNIVEEHREKCDKNCAVSLGSLRELGEAAGLTFTDEEKQLFV